MEEKQKVLAAEIADLANGKTQFEESVKELGQVIEAKEKDSNALKQALDQRDFEIKRRDEVIKQYEDQNDCSRAEMNRDIVKIKKIKDLEEISLLITNYRRQQVYE
jgi:hypothetical protein